MHLFFCARKNGQKISIFPVSAMDELYLERMENLMLDIFPSPLLFSHCQSIVKSEEILIMVALASFSLFG